MLLDYFKSHLKGILLWTEVCIVFGLIFALYELPIEAVLYGAAISGFFGIIYGAADFLSYRQKRLRLKRLADEIIYTVDGLPECGGVEGDYTELIKLLFKEKRRAENEMSAKYSDMNDYYTLWAHQIKTPIAAMGLILQERDDENSRELWDNLQKIERYAEMVLCYIRLDSDSTDYVIKEYDLDGIVRQAVRKFSRQFIRKRLRLTYQPLGRTVLTDEKWLMFVIEQVLSNAVKYTKNGGVELYIEEPLTLCVRDTGIGIAQEDLPRIFEKGYTGCNGRFDKKASGIGFYLCRRICRGLGHEISAECPSDGGTIIKIRLDRKSIEIE